MSLKERVTTASVALFAQTSPGSSTRRNGACAAEIADALRMVISLFLLQHLPEWSCNSIHQLEEGADVAPSSVLWPRAAFSVAMSQRSGKTDARPSAEDCFHCHCHHPKQCFLEQTKSQTTSKKQKSNCFDSGILRNSFFRHVLSP